MDTKTSSELREHMLWTYYGLRGGLAILGISLPLLLLVAGLVLHDTWLEPSISRYYYTPDRFGAFITRDLFVGGLVAVGMCLYLYKGFSDKENVALNFGGAFAVLVALLPPGEPTKASGIVATLHGISAVLFFLCIAYVSLWRSRDTLELLPESRRPAFSRLYTMTGVAMVVSPLAAVVLSFVLEPASRFRTLIFFVETLAIWAFAAYWIIKTKEMRISDAEMRSLGGALKRAVVSAPERSGAPAPAEKIVPEASPAPPSESHVLSA